jgi:hypothetical protein
LRFSTGGSASISPKAALPFCTVIGCELGRSKRINGYNSLKNAGVFLNIVGVAAVAAVAAHTDIS